MYEDIKVELKKYNYVLYSVTNNKYKFEMKFIGKKKELHEKILKKYKKSNIDYYIYFKLSFHTGTKIFQGGPLAIRINSVEIVDGVVKKKHINANGKQIWFQRKYLDRYGWSDNYYETMMNKIINNKVILKPLVVNMYNVTFE